MAKTKFIELPGCDLIPIIYEDRSVLAIDKPRGWMLVPDSWRKTNWNLQTAIDSSIRADDFWARSRNLTYLRHVHRLDADTSGVMLFAKSEGAMRAMGDMFESRSMEKTYLAIVEGVPKEKEWTCDLPIGPDPLKFGKMMVDRGEEGKEAETHFRVLTANERFTLIEASPLTGRTHQIRLHLAESGSPIMCDEIYGRVEKGFRLGLRAVRLAYKDTFTRRPVSIIASAENFLKEFGFKMSPELQSAKWVRPRFIPKEEKGQGTKPPLAAAKRATTGIVKEQ
ncbi:MAG TPA: RNA pseudouridine synthase [Candidatus Acidoferrales bacterium]|nr:RNA pseudouridine synthase [Candidatus Acidoferrales bacterium]